MSVLALIADTSTHWGEVVLRMARMWARELRLRQWVKNGLIFFPLIFANMLGRPDAAIKTVLATALFSLLASSIYILNDIVDLPYDRVHPRKQYRPVASGKISIPVAITVFAGLLMLSLWGSYQWLNLWTFGAFVAYYIGNLTYSLYLKARPPADIITVGLFYLVRPVVGALAIGVSISNWLIITTFFAALYLVGLKRMSELQAIRVGRTTSRQNIMLYNLDSLRAMNLISIAVALISYAIYASGFPHLFVLTVIPLTVLAFRALMLQEGRLFELETPERLVLGDGLSVIFLLGWLILVLGYHLPWWQI